jgi:class 3 adenylate cyclase
MTTLKRVAQASELLQNNPNSIAPKHLAEKILTSKATLEGERRQVTVLFADLKGSMELLANRDPEDAQARRSSLHADDGFRPSSFLESPTFRPIRR